MDSNVVWTLPRVWNGKVVEIRRDVCCIIIGVTSQVLLFSSEPFYIFLNLIDRFKKLVIIMSHNCCLY